MKKDTNPALRICAVLAVLVVLALAVYTLSRFLRYRASAEPDEPVAAASEADKQRTDQTRLALESGDSIVGEGKRYVPKKGVESYLIMGMDRTEAQIASGRLSGQADLLLLLVVDVRGHSYQVLQLNRDTVSQINVVSEGGYITGSLFYPICLAHSFAPSNEEGCENTVTSVRYLLDDAPIDGYLAVSLESIGLLNEAVGGVTVTIDKDMTDADPSFTEGASVKLDARTAEAYVRARMNLGEDNNLSRMQRQRQFMLSWLTTAQTKTAQDAQFAIRLLRNLEPVLTTNLTEKRLTGLVSDLAGYENGGFITIDGEYRWVDDYNFFYADKASLREAILTLFYTEESES